MIDNNNNEYLSSIIEDLIKLEDKINVYISRLDTGLKSTNQKELAAKRLAAFILDIPDTTLPGMNNLELKQLIDRYNYILKKIHNDNNNIENNNLNNIQPSKNRIVTITTI